MDAPVRRGPQQTKKVARPSFDTPKDALTVANDGAEVLRTRESLESGVASASRGLRFHACLRARDNKRRAERAERAKKKKANDEKLRKMIEQIQRAGGNGRRPR